MHNNKTKSFTIIIRQAALITLILFSANYCFARQEDSVSNTSAYGPVVERFSVGTNFIQTGTGTLNVLVNYRYLYLSEVQVGIGYLPLRGYFDAINFIDTGHPLVDTGFDKGFYLNGGLNWITYSRIDGILNCISIDWRKWYFLSETKTYTKARYSFSFGKRIQLNPLLSLEGSIGPTYVRYKKAAGWNNEYFAVDFGLVINFHLQSGN